MRFGIVHFEEAAEPAQRLAQRMGCTAKAIAVHRFPDDESLVRVPAAVEQTALVYCSLDRPNARLFELLLATAALRDNGVNGVALVAPYLAYMRQDIAFHPGEAVSQRVIGRLLAETFDAVFTVDPHLHRIASLSEVMPGTEAVSLTAGKVLSSSIDPSDAPVLVGPDSESRQWVERIAAPHGLQVLIGRKERTGDRAVSIAIDGIAAVKSKRAILVDDVIASGVTLQVAARKLLAEGAVRVDALATHCLAGPGTLGAMRKAGIRSVLATDSVTGPVSRISIAPVLAEGLAGSRFLADG